MRHCPRDDCLQNYNTYSKWKLLQYLLPFVNRADLTQITASHCFLALQRAFRMTTYHLGYRWTVSAQGTVAYITDSSSDLTLSFLGTSCHGSNPFIAQLLLHTNLVRECNDILDHYKILITFTVSKIITFWSRAYKNILPNSHWGQKNFCPGFQWEKVQNDGKKTPPLYRATKSAAHGSFYPRSHGNKTLLQHVWHFTDEGINILLHI